MHYLHLNGFSADNSYPPASGYMFEPGLINKYVRIYISLLTCDLFYRSCGDICYKPVFWWYLGKLSSGCFVIVCERTLWRDSEIKDISCSTLLGIESKGFGVFIYWARSTLALAPELSLKEYILALVLPVFYHAWPGAICFGVFGFCFLLMITRFGLSHLQFLSAL